MLPIAVRKDPNLLRLFQSKEEADSPHHPFPFSHTVWYFHIKYFSSFKWKYLPYNILSASDFNFGLSF